MLHSVMAMPRFGDVKDRQDLREEIGVNILNKEAETILAQRAFMNQITDETNEAVGTHKAEVEGEDAAGATKAQFGKLSVIA